ncbi:MAG: helix-turn-helix transcriptional regulator [Pseudomonadota bacterium]
MKARAKKHSHADLELSSLRESVEQLTQVFNASVLGMRVIDNDFNIVQLNQSFCSLAGITLHEGLTRKCHTVFSGSTCHSPECSMAQIVKGMKHIERLVERKNIKGHSIQCLMHVTPLLDRSGRLVGIVEQFIDAQNSTLAPADLSPDAARNRRDKALTSTLKTLLDETIKYRSETEDSVLHNVKRLINPCLEKLKDTSLTDKQKTLFDELELHLNTITSPFIKQLSSKLVGLSPAEIEAARQIKLGKTNDEIAEALFISKNTIISHRHHIRTKLKLKNKNINLRTDLHTFV